MRSKKFISVILSVCIFFSLFVSVGATANTTAEKAEVLKTLTLFASTTMNSQVKRFEAAVYTVRILGKEAFVKENAAIYKNTGYPDVDSNLWYAPYIGYCKEQKLIMDAVNGKFLPDDYITEKAFIRFIINAMGYKYPSDYKLANIYSVAYEIGLYTDIAYKTKTADNKNFIKTDVVNILYNALSKPKKGTKIKMIQNLVAEKVISRETALSTGLLTDSVITAVQQVMVMDQNNIFIKINEPIQSLAADNIKIFRTGSPDKTLAFTIKSQGNDGSIVLNTAAQEAFTSYTIELINLKDDEGNETALVTGSFEGIQGSEIKSDFFKISKVVPVSKDSINIYFTQPVNLNTQIPSCYEIWSGESLFVKGSSQTLTVQKIAGTDNGVSLYMKNMTFTKDTLYILKVSGELTGAYGVKLNDGSGDSMKFKGVDYNGSVINSSASDLILTNISLVDSQTMRLEFNMEITPTLAKQNINYYITDAAGAQLTVKKAALTSETGKNNRIVLVSINGVFAQAATYSLEIDYLTDASRQYTIDGGKYSFTASYSAKVNLLINSVSSIDGNTIKINFNKALDQEAAGNVSNYLITGVNHIGYSVIPAKAIYEPNIDPFSVKLYLPAASPLLQDKVYIVNAMATLKDSLGTAIGSKIPYVLTCSNGSIKRPAIKEAVIISSDSIRVDFNKEIVLNEPAILTTNYILQYNDGGDVISRIPVSMCIIDKTRMILKFDKLDTNITYKLGVGNIEDYSGNNAGTDAGWQGAVSVTVGK